MSRLDDLHNQRQAYVDSKWRLVNVLDALIEEVDEKIREAEDETNTGN